MTAYQTQPSENDAQDGKPAGELGTASQWQLIWRRFKRHKLAVASGLILLGFYAAAALCEFVAPYDPNYRNVRYIQAPPQRVHFIDNDGVFHFRPFVYGHKIEVNDQTWQRIYTENTDKRYPLSLFGKGSSYKLWNLIPMRRHLFVARGKGYIHILGTDKLGRDMFSRIIYGARISLSIGLIGVFLTFLIGVALGGIGGYLGGIVDNMIQRFIEVIKCIPKLPLWMTLSAALPATWSGIKVYLGITIILSFIGWTGLARVVRGKFLSLRDEDFVVAASLLGASRTRIIFKHLLPSFTSHIITAATLAVPSMILGETALSFLGIGLRPPIVSWGVLLQDAQNYLAIKMTPWLLAPGLCVVIVVIAFNLLGDGLRDAADPYH